MNLPTQQRTRCNDCRREWIWRSKDSGPPGNCPVCGSPEIVPIEFQGFFDSTTPPELLATAIGQATVEAAARVVATHLAPVTEEREPPGVLVGAGAEERWDH
jgi:hypothetical protein